MKLLNTKQRGDNMKKTICIIMLVLMCSFVVAQDGKPETIGSEANRRSKRWNAGNRKPE
jgi:hypothetical protein